MYDNEFGILGEKQSMWKQKNVLEANNTEVNVTEDTGGKLKMDSEPAESKLIYSFKTQTNQQLAQKYHIEEI